MQKQVEEINNRNALFAGAAQADDERPDAEKNTDELVQQAVREHKETTDTAQRALKVMENTRQVKDALMQDLDQQGKTINKIDDHIAKVDAELTYAEKLLLYMRMCCCCWMFDSCTGADPEDARKKQWEKSVSTGKTVAKTEDIYRRAEEAKAQASAETSRRTTRNASAGGAGPQHRDPDIRLPAGHEKTAMNLQNETSKQNDIIDKVHQGLDDLLAGAKAIGDELGKQNKALDGVQDKASNAAQRIEDMNTKSQLRKYPGKK
eukprot:CAMPEP_0202920734 /NCGR_PEP_ID=MMETSP1392-20130828/77013_1 /ASSEMBLY_ACC=CAM_ASM_000868 /TAXON_ID=225041 /ORGANISM="Chlamydomonas chlamydogama, Strain SAG 11-48b" /LENGTH=262 /DNA_ID=CAMNT_0049614245 /DNA_START=63 /DNA_END=851 /DNA_ORIENTATION=+